MISLDCKQKNYIFIFFLLFLCQSCFGFTKSVYKSKKEKKSAFEKHLILVNSKSASGNKVAYGFCKIAGKDLKDVKAFTNCYYIWNGKFYFVQDLFFSGLDNYSDFENLYIPENDSGDWINQVIIASEEERIAAEIEEMDNSGEDFQYEEFDSGNLAQKIEEKIDGTEQENYFLDRESALSHMSYKDEIFMIQKKADGFIAIHTNENSIQRYYYDSQFRTTKKENWNRDATENLSNDIYEYDEDFVKPVKKIIEKLAENPAKREEISFNENGLAYESKIFVLVKENIDDKTNKSKKDEKVKDARIFEKIKSVSDWEFDDENRVIKSIQKNYTYDDTYSKLKDVFEKKYVYMYHDAAFDEEGNEIEIPADTEYYEDDVLRMRFVYKTKADYTKQYYFDNDFNITSIYKSDKLTKEIYRTGKKIVRIKTYDD